MPHHRTSGVASLPSHVVGGPLCRNRSHRAGLLVRDAATLMKRGIRFSERPVYSHSFTGCCFLGSSATEDEGIFLLPQLIWCTEGSTRSKTSW